MTQGNSAQDNFTPRTDWDKLIQSLVPPEPVAEYRRQSQRYPVEGEIRATSLSEIRSMIQAWNLRNISAEGLGVRATREVLEGTRFILDIKVMEQTFRIQGRVKHCTPTVGGYKIGVRLLFDD